MADVIDRLRAALADRYRIDREIGQGGMATVYLATDLRHHRDVALKVLRPELAATLGPERFLREIEIAARLQHPNILPVYDSGEAVGCLYYVMPYVEGLSLRERLSVEGELPVAEAVRILRDVADALAYAHSQGVLHRDVKPGNIMLAGRHALVADFGVAKAVHEATGRQNLTTVGVALGTPAYMPPEQAAADPHADHRADIYAFGVTAYEVLAGRPPFTGITAQAILAAQLTEAPAPVSGLRPLLPPPLAQLVMQCLEKKPADRPQSADELLQVLESLAAMSGVVTPQSTWPRRGTAPARRRRAALVSVLATLGVIVFAAVAVRVRLHRPLNVVASDIRPVTTDPGVELHPAISPDGREVAYAGGAITSPHLMIRSTSDVPGASALRLGEAANELFPAWSADGELVRFAGCGEPETCSWNEVGKLGGGMRPVRLPPRAASALLAWSPDGSQIAYAIGDRIFTAAVGDTVGRQVAVHKNITVLHSLAWSPDGERIAYVDGNRLWLSSGNVWGSSIWVVAAAGGTPQLVTTDEHINVSPVWLDARHLLFVSNRDGPRGIYVVEVGPHGARGAPRMISGIADPHSLSYSLAARRLVWTKFNVRQNIWSYPLGRSTPLSIADGQPVTTGSNLIEAHDVSPDGRWLVFDSDRGSGMGLYKMPVVGGEAIPLTDFPGEEYDPRWSPDGTEIVFYGDHTRCGENDVMVIPSDGGVPATVTCSPVTDGGPRWSPDGLSIAFYSTRGNGRWELWVTSRDGLGAPWREPARLNDSDVKKHDYEWSPDGRGVLSVLPDGRHLLLTSPDGRILWRYDLGSSNGLTLNPFSEIGYTRDGRSMYLGAVHHDGRQGIWSMPAGGGPARLVIAFDAPALAATFGGHISIGPDRLYLTVSEYESDIWVANLRY